MAIRLYDSAWVRLFDVDDPQQVLKDLKKPDLFHAGGFHYDIDGRPYYVAQAAPKIVEILSIEKANALGLSTRAHLRL